MELGNCGVLAPFTVCPRDMTRVVHTCGCGTHMLLGIIVCFAFSVLFPVLVRALVLGTFPALQRNDPLWSGMWGGEEGGRERKRRERDEESEREVEKEWVVVGRRPRHCIDRVSRGIPR